MGPEDIYTFNPIEQISNLFGISKNLAIILLTIIGVWSLVWKGLALWKSSKKNQPLWFVIILVATTWGILEILYIYLFSKMDFSSKAKLKNNLKSNSKKKK
jgi:hypothetical protein